MAEAPTISVRKERLPGAIGRDWIKRKGTVRFAHTTRAQEISRKVNGDQKSKEEKDNAKGTATKAANLRSAKAHTQPNSRPNDMTTEGFLMRQRQIELGFFST